MDSPITIDGSKIAVTASIGIAVVRSEDQALSSTEMLKRADLALYAAKRAGKATLSVYNQDLRPQANDDQPLAVR